MPHSSSAPSSPPSPPPSEHGQTAPMTTDRASSDRSSHPSVGSSRSGHDARSSSATAAAADSGGGSGTLLHHPNLVHLSFTERTVLKIPEKYYVTISGGMAGAASGIVSCPLDVIKTKLQAQGGFMARRLSDSATVAPTAYRGVSGTARTIWREDGVRGLYRGLGPMLLGYVPTWAVYLTVYNAAQGYFSTKTDSRFVANMWASLAGGTCSTLVTNPIWVIKTRLQSQSSTRTVGNNPRAPWHYRNTIDAARKMYLHEGLLSFYSGLTPALLGLSHVAVQFPLYEVLKVRFTGIEPGAITNDTDQIRHFWGLSLAVFLSKVVASTATYPHEVVRTRLQTQQRGTSNWGPAYSSKPSLMGSDDHRRVASSDGMMGRPLRRGTLQTCRTILAEEGWRGFYAGLGTNLIRAVPSAMTTILTFEYLKQAFYHTRGEAFDKLEEEDNGRY